MSGKWSLVFFFFAVLTGLFGLEGTTAENSHDALVMSCIFFFFGLISSLPMVARKNGRVQTIRRV